MKKWFELNKAKWCPRCNIMYNCRAYEALQFLVNPDKAVNLYYIVANACHMFTPRTKKKPEEVKR